MSTVNDLNKYADLVLEKASADQTETLVYSQSSALTRFSNEEIHQNVSEKNTGVTIRSIFGKKTGTASTNALDEDSVKTTVEISEKNAGLSPEDQDFISLPRSETIVSDKGYSQATAETTPIWRAEVAGFIIERAAKNGLTAAGAVSVQDSALVVANSLGSRAAGKLTEVNLNVVVMGEDSSGYADYISKDISRLDLDSVVGVAVSKALASASPLTIEPGRYTVILEPPAVADMLGFLAYAGLGALSVQEKRSFMLNNFGNKIVSELVNIWDDATDPRTLGLPFDFEAVPKQKVVFFENGVAENVVYDSYTASREGKSSTGHALPASSAAGPLPLNLFMGTGDVTLDNMIKTTEKGILVSRFHYTNLEDPLKTVFTGMTRDGTFLIENGTIKKGIRNLRFTQSILEALNNVEMVSVDGRLSDSFLGAAFTPALKISRFNFTGITEF